MNTRDFEQVKRALQLTADTIKNDPKLGIWLVERAAVLLDIGLEELKSQRHE